MISDYDASTGRTLARAPSGVRRCELRLNGGQYEIARTLTLGALRRTGETTPSRWWWRRTGLADTSMTIWNHSFGRARSGGPRAFLNHFVMEFDDAFTEQRQYGDASVCEVIVPTPTRPGTRFDLAMQPAVALHALQEWIQRPRADVVAVPSKLPEHPLADDGMLCRVVQDVHLPEPEQDLTGQQLVIDGGHSLPSSLEANGSGRNRAPRP